MIAYETIPARDDRPWLTLVHGFSHHRRYFAPGLDALTSGFNVLLIDLRGHGASADLPGPFGIEEHADDLQDVLRREGIERTHYWGTHTGAAVGLVLALREPPRIGKLVLEGVVVPGLAMPVVTAQQERAAGIARARGTTAAVDDWWANAGWFANMHAFPEATNAAAHGDLVKEFTGRPWLADTAPRPQTDVRSRIHLIRRPTMVYNGSADLDEFKRAAAFVSATLTGVRRVEIPHAGGFPLWERPDLVLAAVLPFLAE